MILKKTSHSWEDLEKALPRGWGIHEDFIPEKAGIFTTFWTDAGKEELPFIQREGGPDHRAGDMFSDDPFFILFGGGEWNNGGMHSYEYYGRRPIVLWVAEEKAHWIPLLSRMTERFISLSAKKETGLNSRARMNFYKNQGG